MKPQINIRCLGCRSNITLPATVVEWTVKDAITQVTHKMDCHGTSFTIETAPED